MKEGQPLLHHPRLEYHYGLHCGMDFDLTEEVESVGEESYNNCRTYEIWGLKMALEVIPKHLV